MHRVGMTGLPERRAAAAAIFAETRLRFQRPSARQSSATCAAAALAPRRPRAHGGHQSRCEQAQSGGRPIVCAPSSSTAPTAAANRGQQRAQDDERKKYHVRKHAHAEEEQRWWRVARRRAATPGFKIEGPVVLRKADLEEPLFGKLSVHFCTLALHRFGSTRSPARPRWPSAGMHCANQKAVAKCFVFQPA
jgi:hypothetical protein